MAYRITFNGTVSNENSDERIFARIVVDGSPLAGSERELMAESDDSSDGRYNISCVAYVTGLATGKVVKVQWKTSDSGSVAHVRNRSLFIRGVG